MSSLSRSIGVACLLLLLSGCGGGPPADTADATAVSGPVVTFPPLTRTSSAAPTTEAPATETATVVVTKTVQATSSSAAPGPSQVDAARFRPGGSQSGYDYGFVSPTGNVACSVFAAGTSADAVACQAQETAPARDGSYCNAPDRILSKVTTDRAQHGCAPADTYRYPGMATLGYGSTLTVGLVTCTSDFAAGIVCRAGNPGLRLSREINDVF